MHYLAGLLIAVSVLLSGTQAFAYDNKNGHAALSFYDDPQQKVYYIDSINSPNSMKLLSSAAGNASMDNTKIATVFGDIKIASREKFIIDNKTTHRLEFEELADGFNISGAFIVRNKSNNKELGSNSNVRVLHFNSDTNKVTFENKTYNKRSLIITTMNGAIISVDKYTDGVDSVFDGYRITLRQDKYEFTTTMSIEGIWCQFGLAGRK